MKSFYTKLLLFIIFLWSIGSNGQTTIQEYLDMEEARIMQADSIMNIVENYINSNLSTYNLTQTEIDDITDDLYNIHDGSSNPITGSKLDSIFQEIKKYKLKNLYFQQNASDTLYFIPTNIPVELRQQCINGGFESGLANYTFRESIKTPPQHFDGNECLTTDNLDNILMPSGALNNFTASATLVSPGNEPYLANLNIFINRVLTGNRAIKLNPSATIVNNQTGNRVSMSRSFIVNENQLEFSFLYFGHTTAANSNNNHDDPFFRYRLVSSNGTELFSNCYSVKNTDCRFSTVSDPTLGNGTNDQISYTPSWICERIDTRQWIGQNVTLEFLVTDCEYRGHFSTVYIDNICGVSCTPTWGSLMIDPVDINCPTSEFDVCGNYVLPNGTNLTSLTMDIIDTNTNNVIDTVNNPSINGNDFCFTLDPSDFGTSGNYTFEITLNTNSTCNELSSISEIDGSITFEDCSTPCDVVGLGNISGNMLCWDDITDGDYTIEFITQESCPNGASSDPVPSYQSYTQQSNCINLETVQSSLGGKCFRWRIRTECSDWSDWCLIGAGSTSQSNPFVNWGECIPSNPCENFDASIDVTDDILIGTVNYDTYVDITANNSIESGATSLYQASNSIILREGFHAKSGSTFTARIIPCDPAIEQPVSQRLSERIEKSEKIKAVPNPASNSLTVSIENMKIQSLELYDIYGNVVLFKKQLDTEKQEINVERFARGYYILKATLDDGSIQYKNIILK